MDSRNYKRVGVYGSWQDLTPQLDPGDLVEIDRFGGRFQHWAVTMEIVEGKVIIVNVNGDFLTGLGAIIGTRKDGALADVRVEELSTLVGDNPCRVNNGIDEEFDPFKTGAEVVERGVSQIGEHQYDMWNNNCQHWANWCRNGHLHSLQAEQAERQIEELKDMAKIDELMEISKSKYEEFKSKLLYSKQPEESKDCKNENIDTASRRLGQENPNKNGIDENCNENQSPVPKSCKSKLCVVL